MNTILYTLLLACSVFLSGCCRTRQIPEAVAREKEPPEMIQIRNLTLTDKTLTLDYRVSNPFEDDIRVCYDTWVHGKQGVQDTKTRIDGETVWIKLSFNVEPSGAFQNPPTVGKYVRLPPGESYSGRILKDLPLRDYSREPRRGRGRKERKEIVLHRAVFEVGYFGPKWNKFFDSKSERIKQEPIKSKPTVIRSFYYLSFNPFITEETLNGKLREVIYVQPWSSVRNQECAEVLITDVDIPCSVAIDDK